MSLQVFYVRPTLRRRGKNGRDTSENYNQLNYIGIEALTAVTMKNTVVWDVTLFGLVEVYQHFGKLPVK
jgi:hypothetical protein